MFVPHTLTHTLSLNPDYLWRSHVCLLCLNKCLFVFIVIVMTLLAHMQFRCFETKVSEGVAQLTLRLHHLCELTGQSLCQLHHQLIFPLVITQHIDMSLQLQIHGA